MNGTIDLDRFERLVDQLAEQVTGLAVVRSEQLSLLRSVHTLETDLRDEREKRLQLGRDLDKWVNRGWGAWAAVVLVFTLVTANFWPAKASPEVAQVVSAPKRDLPSQPVVAGKP